MGLLDNNLNFEKQRAGRIGRLASRIPPSAEVKNKRTKSELSVRNELRFANFGIHILSSTSSRKVEDGVNWSRVAVSGR
jgi:hypothetical protein